MKKQHALNPPSLQERCLGKARLVALRSADGYWNVKVDNATIGKDYQVDLKSIRRAGFVNKDSGKYFECQIIDVFDDSTGEFIHYPTELLQLLP